MRPSAPSASRSRAIRALDRALVDCRQCPRLVAWREQVARDRRAAYADEVYWGRPVPSFGAADPRILIVGLAPAAHGANRTGRMFTGDRSGDWLFASLHRCGLADLPTSTHRDDGQGSALVRITAAVHCAPPGNAPTPAEQAACSAWLDRELGILLPGLSAIVTLGAIAWSATAAALGRVGAGVPRPRPRFGHGAEYAAARPARQRGGAITVLGSYHPSQQNTFTGRLTEPMLDAVMTRARRLAED